MALETRSQRLRMSILGAVALSLFAALFARVWYLQVINEQQLTERAAQNTTREIIEQAPRGRILDVNGRILVDNRPSIEVTIDKETITREVDDVDDLFLRLAKLLSSNGQLTKVSTIRTAYESDRYGPFAQVPVVRDISKELQVFLAEHSFEFPGVGTQVVTVRDYPYGTLAAHVLGYVGLLNEEELVAVADKPKTYQPNDEIGKSGIEAFYEDQLRGTPGRQVVIVDKFSNILSEVERVEPVAGSDIQLTIDIDIQSMAEEQLAAGLERARTNQPTEFLTEGTLEYRAPAGSVVLIDPRDGSVRAMASYPTYDPSAFVGGIADDVYAELSDPDGDKPLLNRVIQGTYAPGSTFKPFTAYAALDTGLIGSRGILGINSPYNDTGVFQIPGCESETCRFTNAQSDPKGPVDLATSLTVSSDVYYYNLAYNFDVRQGFDRASIQQAATQFGFGSPTGITLPDEASGRMPTPESRRAAYEASPEDFVTGDWLTGDTIITSIGQGDVLATPIQIADAYATIANGGTRYAPNLAAAVLDPVSPGVVQRTFGPRVQDEIYFPERWRAPILTGLSGAVRSADDGTSEGTASGAFAEVGFDLDTWPVAGKTGTAEVQSIGRLTADTALFAAFGPVPDPEVVGVVVLEEAGYGGRYAAPVLAALFDAIATDSVPPARTVRELEDDTADDGTGGDDVALGEVDG